MELGTGSVLDGQRVIPLTVLTGFLGSGKTTLLNRILNDDHGLRIAVLVNDFGSINIDADLIVGIESAGDVISLANGCVCCNIRDDLLAAVTNIVARPERPEYILLEASGVADPSGIALTFVDEGLRDHIRLDSIMCVVDAAQVFAAPEMMELKIRQIAFADMLLLNKADLVSREEIARIRAWLDERFNRYRLVESTRGDVPLDILLSVGRFDPAQLDATPHHHGGNHSKVYSTWIYETTEPLSLDALRETAKRLPASIYRCKGIVNSADVPGRRAILQVVGKRVDLTMESDWGDRTPRTQIVAIGASGGIDPELLERTFAACISDQPLS